MSYLGNLKMFVRVYELGSMSAAARDQRVSAAVASARIAQLESHLQVRLFQRTTRSLNPTEQGRIFYKGAREVLEAVDAAETAVTEITQKPRGSLLVSAPLGLGRRHIAPHVPAFCAEYPEIEVRLRLTDRMMDVMGEALDLAFILGRPEDSTLTMRQIAECQRVLCASPAYVERYGHPKDGTALIDEAHRCLQLRFPGAEEFRWQLQTEEGPTRFPVHGPFASDDADVLTDWALAGEGIMMKPVFEIEHHLKSGALVPVAEATPPLPVTLACLYVHRRLQDPKARLFIDYMADRIGPVVRAATLAPV